MSYLAIHLTYQFLPPLLSGVLANIIDGFVARSSSSSSGSSKAGKVSRRAGAGVGGGKGKDSRGKNGVVGIGRRWLQSLGVEWRDGPVGSEGWRKNRVVSSRLCSLFPFSFSMVKMNTSDGGSVCHLSMLW